VALRRNALVELFWLIHPRLYRWSGGRIGGKLVGLPVLLLETTGRRSGKRRRNALTYLPHGDDFVVIASCLGEPRHPAWWHNLVAEPRARVQVGSTSHAVRAREATGDERAELWHAVTQRAPDYDEYEARTSRRIPVVVLERSQGSVSDS
jgi:deazaflavin-dependent oxidoreductase (nitroreductase family)